MKSLRGILRDRLPKQVPEKCPTLFRQKSATSQDSKQAKRGRSHASLLSGTIAAALACVMVLQAIAESLALGAMLAAGPQSVICSPNGPRALPSPLAPDAPASTAPLWDCATLCQLACASAPAILAGATGVLSTAPLPAVAGRPLPDLVLPSFHLQAIAEARAPPFLSV